MSLANVKKPYAASTHLFSSRHSTLEKGLTSAVNVGHPLAKAPTLLYTAEFTLEKGLAREVLVGSPIDREATSLGMSEFTARERSYKCGKCGRAFMYKYRCVQHQRTQSGERSYN